MNFDKRNVIVFIYIVNFGVFVINKIFVIVGLIKNVLDFIKLCNELKCCFCFIGINFVIYVIVVGL